MASSRTLRFVLVFVLLCARPLQGQDLAYLAQVPTAEQVAQGLAVPSMRETAARRYAALFALGNLVGSSLGTRPPTAEERQRMADFDRAREAVYEAEKQRDPVNYLLERCSQAYLDSPAFQRELLDLYFTPAWQATYGPRLDPRRWKVPLAMAPGARVTAASMSPPMVAECGSAPAAAAPRTATAALPSNPVERERAEAYAMLQAGDTVRALDAYKRIVSAYPSRTEGYVGLGLIYVSQHQYALALPAWQKVAELAPTDAFSLYMVGASYVNLRRYEEAVAVLRTVTRMKARPEVLGWAHYSLGVAYLRLGQREGAMESYRALAVLDTVWANKLAAELNAPPKAGGATGVAAKPAERQIGRLAAEGDAYLKAGDTTRAVAAYKASTATDPSEVLGYTGLGRIYSAQRQYPLSVEAWQKAVALVPNDWSVWMSLGVAHYGSKQFPEARDAYLKAIRAKPPPEYAGHLYQGLGAVYLQLGQRDSAVAVYRALVPIDSVRASALAARINKADEAAKVALPPAATGRTLSASQKAEVEALRAEGKRYYDAEDYVKARGSYEKLLRLDPNDGWALHELGKSMLMIEGSSDIDSMLVVWRRALALEPTDTELLLALGDDFYSWDPEAAHAAFQRVLDLKPDAATQARAHAGKAWSWYFYSMTPEAAAEMTEAIQLDPKNDQYVYDLGIIYNKGGQKDAARAQFRQLTTRNQKMAQALLAEINRK